MVGCVAILVAVGGMPIGDMLAASPSRGALGLDDLYGEFDPSAHPYALDLDHTLLLFFGVLPLHRVGLA